MHGTCEIADPTAPTTISSDASSSDDLDHGERPKAERRPKPESDLADNSRPTDARHSDGFIPEAKDVDLNAGRDPDKIPNRVPPPRDMPDEIDVGDKTDDPDKASAPLCQKGSTRPCYPDQTRGCSEYKTDNGTSFQCIAPCAPGTQTCEDKGWGACKGLRTPTKEGECTQSSTPDQFPKECPPDKKQINGRCI